MILTNKLFPARACTRAFKAAGLILVFLALAACAGMNAAGDESTVPVHEFVARSLETIEVHTLSNGVPVIIKHNDANRVFSLKVIWDGGVAMTTPEQAGIEAFTLALMTRGTADYSYSMLNQMEYELSSAISSSAVGYDWASLDLNTLDKYWDELFSVFAACVMSPAFSEDEFNQLKSETVVALQSALRDPYNIAVQQLNQQFFAGHPYQADFAGTIASIQALTLAQVRDYYTQKLAADRMAIVAVGNFNADELVADLEATLGTMGRTGVTKPAIPAVRGQTDVIQLPLASSKDVAYVRGNYIIAPANSRDFVALQLAYSMLNELLFDILRTEHGACYSTWSNAHGFRVAYGSLVVFKTDQPENVKAWIDEAIAVLAAGNSKNITVAEGNYAPLADTIEAYKAKYINSFFGNQQTNAEMAAQLASSLVTYGRPTEYLFLIDKINAITADDIVRVINRYVVDAPITWIIASDGPTLARVDESVYRRYTGH
ncbi:MAG: hypothetical protein A2087_12500 [Spirochaetes bacterium GWD1_61_31]|nr:MAG: hypothetical protein A2Y37_11510 [Spirochaetes bacterium GWB1_60_80]OHD31644.1 MAG: hypothetical protein A2004_03420 [Spirochaetes bacterium GWC1_61_12]OHD38340.1 MAG: hypothetical protein A2087_12500 [Spirochaetes bacterium GWD1_61_31]OHD43393.1 MAG: hypothetical protein A2Y35_02280 [Spirochaetes bacterium GWE1_60_18]OHD58926.1 MAG: hypothetical protein A2Y32_10725 [Spirochaetes bacterium GWF1_60_12]HAP42980.1 hypothetical protein [Spirochaetaceae bacterium]